MPDQTDAFVLDRTENPHPRMLEHALQLRRAFGVSDDPLVGAVWLGYLDCMCDATGENAQAIHAWLDSHDDPALTEKITADRAAVLPMPRRR